MAPISPNKSSDSNGALNFGNKIIRRKLQTLQVSADRNILVGGQRSGLNSLPKKFQIFHDSEMKKSQENESSVTKSTAAAGKPRRSQRKRQPVIPKVSLSFLDENDELKVPSVKQNGSSVIKATKKSQKSQKSSTKTTLKRVKELRQRKIMFCCLSKQTISSSGSDPESTVAREQKSESDSLKAANATPKQTELPEIVLSNMPSLDIPQKSPSTVPSPLPTLDVPRKLPTPVVPPNEPEISEDFRYLITDSEPPESYWKDISEQRLAALEETLCENARLHDEIEVLKVENSHLLSIVEAARELAAYTHQLTVNEVNH